MQSEKPKYADVIIPLDGCKSLSPELIGSKGVAINTMRRLGLPVPPGFVLPIYACDLYRLGKEGWSEAVWLEVRRHLRRLETETGATLGDPAKPPLVSIRSAASRSMPGMLDTQLNVGLPDRDPDALAQIQLAIDRVIHSWDGERARGYRRWAGIDDSPGTAAIVQAMVFGDRGHNSGTGVAVTARGQLSGEWLRNAQGDSLMAGEISPALLSDLADQMPEVYRDLGDRLAVLEEELAETVEVEFTIEEGRLYLLQVRPVGSLSILRSGATEKSTKANVEVLISGVPASPGVACGRAADDLREQPGQSMVLVREATSPADVPAMLNAAAVVTAKGGFTSHAAVICREAGIPCVVGCGEGAFDLVGRQVIVNGSTGDIGRNLL